MNGAPLPAPAPSPRRRILFVISNGWSVKNFFHTGLLAAVARDFEIAAIVQPAMLESMRAALPGAGLSGIALFPLAEIAESALERNLRRVQKSLLFSRHRMATEAVKSRAARPGLRRLATKLLGGIARHSTGARLLAVLQRLYAGAARRDPCPAAFNEFKPDLLVVAHPVDPIEIRVACQARRRSIPVVADVLSWDNLTSKGVIPDWFASVLVWNETMRREVLTFYDAYREQQIHVTGVPRFDFYRAPLPPPYQRDPFLRGLGLDPAKKILLFANSASSLVPGQPEIIRHLDEAIQSGQLAGCQVLVRQHPRDTVDIPATEHVKVWRQKLDRADVYNWWPDETDAWILAAMMRHADVNINPASTITLESAICDVPVINVAYDGDQPMPYEKSIRRYYDYSHQEPMLRLGATKMAGSREELITLVRRYLENPALERAERFNLANSFCAVGLGLATTLKAEAIRRAALA